MITVTLFKIKYVCDTSHFFIARGCQSTILFGALQLPRFCAFSKFSCSCAKSDSKYLEVIFHLNCLVSHLSLFLLVFTSLNVILYFGQHHPG